MNLLGVGILKSGESKRKGDKGVESIGKGVDKAVVRRHVGWKKDRKVAIIFPANLSH